jgi:hypothetical protein
MSQPEQDESGGRAARLILEQHEKCMQARQEYLSAIGSNVGDDVKQLLHQRLEAAVKSYYEALFYNLANNSAVEEYWEETTLWSEEQPAQTEDGKYVVDKETGAVVYEEVEIEGLKKLKDMFGQTEVVQKEISDNFGTRTVSEEQHKPLPVKVLFRVARTLDEVADELGLLTTTDEKTHRSEITDDMIEEVDEWAEQNL